MADNFDMKQFLFENKLGAYSKLKENEGNPLGDFLYQYELDISGDVDDETKDQLYSLKTLDDVRKYYDQERGWLDDADFKSDFYSLIRTLKKKFPNLKEEIETSDLEVKWTPKYTQNPSLYYEKGLADDFETVNNKKVKEIVGYFENENGDEDFDVIGHIISKSGKDIETEYDIDDLDDAFMDALSKSNVNEELEEAKTVSKEDKIEVIKEWIWYTCDEGDAKDDINKYNKMVDMYFADKDDVTKEDFKKIWAKVIEKYGAGDVGADWEAFPETWKDVQNGTLVNEGEAAYEYEKGKAAGEKEEKAKLTKEDLADAEAEKMMDFLAEYEVIYVVENGICYRKDDEGNLDRVDMYYCKRYAGTGVREEKEKEKESFSDVNEYSRFGKLKYLSPAGFDRASGLVKTDSVRKMLEAAEDMMEDLTNEGFEVPEIREFFTQLIANDI